MSDGMQLRPNIIRWQFQVWLLFGSRAIQSIMRMAMGPLLVYLCDEQRCTAGDKGNALSAFSLGYLSTQVIGGLLGDYAGAREIIVACHLAAGFTMMFTPEAMQQLGFSGLWAATVLLGVLQGPLFPSSMSYLSKWLPAAERSWASAMLDSGITVGSLIVMPLSGWLASWVGWRAAFRVYGLSSLMYATVWYRWSANDPADSAFISQEESGMLKSKANQQKYKRSPAPQQSLKSFLSASVALLSHLPIWALFLSHAAFNFGVYFQNSWTAMYYKETLQVLPESASVDLILPHIVNLVVKAGVAKPLFAWLHESHGFSLLACRRFFTVIGFIGTSMAYAGLVIVSNFDHSRIASTACFTVAMGFTGLHPSGFKANYMDLTMHSSGLLSGLGNTVASIASFIGPLVVGAILSRQQSWPLVFICVGSVNVIAAMIFGICSSTSPVDRIHDETEKNRLQSPSLLCRTHWTIARLGTFVHDRVRAVVISCLCLDSLCVFFMFFKKELHEFRQELIPYHKKHVNVPIEFT